jgi:hypothetical protein
MEELQITAAVIAGILLRFGIPLGLTILLARFLRQLDSRWREEAEQKAIESQLQQQRQTILNLWLDQPCYSINNCTAQQKSICRAFSQTEKPCWEVKRSNGSLAPECLDCNYRQELVLAVEQEKLRS